MGGSARDVDEGAKHIRGLDRPDRTRVRLGGVLDVL
jgi:hypothetical protein